MYPTQLCREPGREHYRKARQKLGGIKTQCKSLCVTSLVRTHGDHAPGPEHSVPSAGDPLAWAWQSDRFLHSTALTNLVPFPFILPVFILFIYLAIQRERP